MNKDYKRVATTQERLTEMLQKTGKRAADLAKETGLHKATIHRYLTGAVEPRQEAMLKLALALNVSETWLWGYDVSPARQDWEADVDIINNAVIRMRSDNDFMSVVEALLALDSEKFSVAKTVVTALKK
ncbi:MAG: helix-turn-helix transcriptional regulator [Clostridia bacterium]|nr:helix-turn-helix transcriptional regulator [Clostridia bacterium]